MNAPPDPVRIKLLIAGLGNVLLMDDGVGVHAVRALQQDPPAGAKIVEVGTAVLDALDWLEAADVVLALDAVQAGGVPGTIYRLDPAKLREPTPRTSLHEFDLRAVLRLLPPNRQPQVTVLGVEPARLDYGLELSPVVQAALPDFLTTIRRFAADSSGSLPRSGPAPL